jgi:hypothetical protein
MKAQTSKTLGFPEKCSSKQALTGKTRQQITVKSTKPVKDHTDIELLIEILVPSYCIYFGVYGLCFVVLFELIFVHNVLQVRTCSI